MGAAAAAAAQPRIPARVPAVIRLHDHPGDFQHLDAAVPAGLAGLQREPRGWRQRSLSRLGHTLDPGGRVAERSPRTQRSRTPDVLGTRGDGSCAPGADGGARGRHRHPLPRAHDRHRGVLPAGALLLPGRCLRAWTSAASRRARLPPGSSTASATSAAVLAGDSVARIAVPTAGKGCSSRSRWSARLPPLCAGVLYVLNTKAAKSAHE